MELFAKLFSSLLAMLYRCYDRMVIHGCLSGLSRPQQVVCFFRDLAGVPVVDKAVLKQRTGDFRNWVEAFARNHRIPTEWAQKGVRKEDYVRPWLRRLERAGGYGVYFIFRSLERGPTFRCPVPKFFKRERGAMNLRRFYAVSQIEYCCNSIFKRHFPIRRIFERSCERGLWRLTANQIPEILGSRITKKAEGQAPHDTATDRARAAYLPRPLETRLPEAARKILHLPAQ